MGYVTTSGREPHAGVFTPDGGRAWITIRGSDHVDIFDRCSKKIVAQVPTGDGPGMVSFEPSGRYAFVSYQKQDVISVIDTRSYDMVREIPVPGNFSPYLLFSTGKKPLLWVIHKDTNKISMIDPRKFQIVDTIDVGNKPNHIAFIIKNGVEYAYVTIARDNRIDVFEVKNKSRFVKSIAVGKEPHGIWTDPEMRRIFVGHEISNDVWVLDAATDEVISKIPVGEKPIDVVYVRQDRQKAASSTDTASIINGSNQSYFFNSSIQTCIVTENLKGDLNDNGIPADAGDLVLMKRASIGEISLYV